MALSILGLLGALGTALPSYIQGARQATQDNWTDIANYNQAVRDSQANAFTDATRDARIQQQQNAAEAGVFANTLAENTLDAKTQQEAAETEAATLRNIFAGTTMPFRVAQSQNAATQGALLNQITREQAPVKLDTLLAVLEGMRVQNSMAADTAPAALRMFEDAAANSEMNRLLRALRLDEAVAGQASRLNIAQDPEGYARAQRDQQLQWQLRLYELLRAWQGGAATPPAPLVPSTPEAPPVVPAQPVQLPAPIPTGDSSVYRARIAR